MNNRLFDVFMHDINFNGNPILITLPKELCIMEPIEALKVSHWKIIK